MMNHHSNRINCLPRSFAWKKVASVEPCSEIILKFLNN
ncbi:hypothetical protein CLERM_269 [Coxiella-like endosymbiont]|nr:hypothetical protein CLERM_269 [Coxiella-like endosymbiont]